MIPSRWRPHRASRLALLANPRPRVRPFDHGIEPRVPGPARRCPLWTSSMKRSSFGPHPGGQRRWMSLVARPTLLIFPDPPRLRIGTEMHTWIVGRIVGALRFGPVLWCVTMVAGTGRHVPPVWRHFAPSARDPRSDGNLRPENHPGLRKWQQVVASGTGVKRSRPQHSMKSNRS